MNTTRKFLIRRTVTAFVLALGNPSYHVFPYRDEHHRGMAMQKAQPVPECMPLAYEACLLHVNVLIAMFVKSVGQGEG